MKLVASLIASAALGLSMLAAVPSTATAAYPGIVHTNCSYRAPHVVKKKRGLVVSYRVRAAGNARPRGVVVLSVYKLRHGTGTAVRLVSESYVGPHWRRTSLGEFKKGRYSTKMSFRPGAGSVYEPCSSGPLNFRVKR